MKQISGKELAKILEKHNWKLARIHGSHYIYTKPGVMEIIQFQSMVINHWGKEF